MGAYAAGGMAIASIVQSQKEAEAIKSQGRFNANQLEFNARLAEMDRADELKRGKDEQKFIKKRGAQMIGSQRAALAAQGIEIDSGTAALIQEETAEQVELESLTAGNNAWRRAWGLEVEALGARTSAAFTRESSRNRARNTLITGGINAIGIGAQGFKNFNKGK